MHIKVPVGHLGLVAQAHSLFLLFLLVDLLLQVVLLDGVRILLLDLLVVKLGIQLAVVALHPVHDGALLTRLKRSLVEVPAEPVVENDFLEFVQVLVLLFLRLLLLFLLFEVVDVLRLSFLGQFVFPGGVLLVLLLTVHFVRVLRPEGVNQVHVRVGQGVDQQTDLQVHDVDVFLVGPDSQVVPNDQQRDHNRVQEDGQHHTLFLFDVRDAVVVVVSQSFYQHEEGEDRNEGNYVQDCLIAFADGARIDVIVLGPLLLLFDS